MNFNKIQNVYLIGIGGIGMSALARYFNTLDKFVAGYDKTPTSLTDQLMEEGIDIHFEENISLIPEQVLSQKESTLIIYTPAIPGIHKEYIYFKEHGYLTTKRSEVLGNVFSHKKGVAVAGTHGKTTTSTMLAHILKQSSIDCNAFLGGISKNYKSNLLLSADSDIIVAEADEYDRSFLRLFPHLAIVTSVDADHLDIYGTHEEVIKSFNEFVSQIKKDGILIYKKGIKLGVSKLKGIKIYTYSITEDADFCPLNIRNEGGFHYYDIKTPDGIIKGVKLGIPGRMNLENSIAASAAVHLLGASNNEIITGLGSFEGVKRRFEYHINNEIFTYIDDYAHHPEELKACITSARNLYPKRKLTGVFQPHLFTRTRDFADGFAESLSLLDEVILLDIYPAREEPIPGVSSEIVFKRISIANKTLCKKEELIGILKQRKPDVLITMGAGDIDKFVEEIKKLFSFPNPPCLPIGRPKSGA
jgi:UDP-N-acetylmuramate--alanine ligase